MEKTLNIDQAIEILELTNVDNLTLNDLKKHVVRMKKRWHPDTIAHAGDPDQIEKFTQRFQLIEPAAELMEAYLQGELHFGEKFQSNARQATKEPHEVIRENAAEIQSKLKNIWQSVQTHQYKMTTEKVTVSDGFVLKDLLREDFRDDIAMLAMISFSTYNSTLGLLTIICLFIFPTLGQLGLLFWLLQALACFLAFLPLSRFWLPEKVLPVIYWFCDIGLSIYNGVSRIFSFSLFVQFSLRFIKLLAQMVKYLLLFPLYEIAKLTIGKKVVGAVRKEVRYFASVADWYVEDLLGKPSAALSEQELYDLSHLYSELMDYALVEHP